MGRALRASRPKRAVPEPIADAQKRVPPPGEHPGSRRKPCDFPCAGKGRAGSPCPPASVMPKVVAGNARTHDFPGFWPNGIRTSNDISLHVPVSGGEGTRRLPGFARTKTQVPRRTSPMMCHGPSAAGGRCREGGRDVGRFKIYCSFSCVSQSHGRAEARPSRRALHGEGRASARPRSRSTGVRHRTASEALPERASMAVRTVEGEAGDQGKQAKMPMFSVISRVVPAGLGCVRGRGGGGGACYGPGGQGRVTRAR